MARYTLDQHDKTAAVLHIANGVIFGLLGGLLWALIRVMPRLLEVSDQELTAEQREAVELVLGISGWMIVAAIAVCALEAIAGAAWLILPNEGTYWLLIANSVIQLINPPIGTAIGGYTLWALLRRRGSSHPADRSPPY